MNGNANINSNKLSIACWNGIHEYKSKKLFKDNPIHRSSLHEIFNEDCREPPKHSKTYSRANVKYKNDTSKEAPIRFQKKLFNTNQKPLNNIIARPPSPPNKLSIRVTKPIIKENNDRPRSSGRKTFKPRYIFKDNNFIFSEIIKNFSSTTQKKAQNFQKRNG